LSGGKVRDGTQIGKPRIDRSGESEIEPHLPAAEEVWDERREPVLEEILHPNLLPAKKEPERAHVVRLTHGFAEETGLSHPGFTCHQDEPGFPIAGYVQLTGDEVELCASSGKGCAVMTGTSEIGHRGFEVRSAKRRLTAGR
jgi:hypothetical protein